jgi:hypothetical protein
MEYNDKQLHILYTAEELFANKGYNGTSVRDIAQEAGVNLAMISYYFGSKEKLLETIFEERSEKSRIQFESIIEDETIAPLQKVYMMVDSYIDKIFNQQCFHKIMMRTQMAVGDNENNLIQELINNTRKRNIQLIKRLINEGQKKGVFKKNIDIVLMMSTMFGTANQMILTKQFYKEMNNMEDKTEEEYNKFLKKKLSHHLKSLFKAILTYEA